MTIEMELTKTLENVTCENLSNTDERQAALDALNRLHAYSDYYGCSQDFKTVSAALQSPQVPVIEGLDEAVIVFEKGIPDLADYETVGVYLADCERYEDRCRMVAKAARAYAKLQKGK